MSSTPGSGHTPTSSTVGVVVADDHDLFRDAVSRLLTDAGGFTVLAQVRTGDAVLPALRNHRPDLLLLDQALPGANGLDVLARGDFPHACKVVLLTGIRAGHLLSEAVGSRADAVVSKNDPPEAVLEAIRAVLAGQRYVGAEVQDLVAATPDLAALTQRELQVLRLVGAGLRNKQVADRLGVSVKTVDTHRTNLMRKLDMHSMAALVDLAVRHGLVE